MRGIGGFHHQFQLEQGRLDRSDCEVDHEEKGIFSSIYVEISVAGFYAASGAAGFRDLLLSWPAPTWHMLRMFLVLAGHFWIFLYVLVSHFSSLSVM